MLERERAGYLGKPKIITDTQPEIEPAGSDADKLSARCVTGAFVVRWTNEEMRLPIAGQNLTARIDEDLRIVNAIAITLGNAGDDRHRKFFCHFLERRDRPFRPRLCLVANHRH